MSETDKDTNVNRLTVSQDSKQFNRSFILKFIDEHIREIRWFLYGVGGIGGLLVLKNIHATKQFGKISEIPDLFIKKNIVLQGKILSFDHHPLSTGSSSRVAILWTIHEPLLHLPFTKWTGSAGLADNNILPIGLAGVEYNPAVSLWLNKNMKNRHTWFKMLEKQEDRLDAIIKYRNGWRKVNVNEELIRKGISKVCYYTVLPKSTEYQNLIDKLVKLESQADKRGVGMWREDKPRYFKTALTYIFSIIKLPFKWFKTWKKK